MYQQRPPRPSTDTTTTTTQVITTTETGEQQINYIFVNVPNANYTIPSNGYFIIQSFNATKTIVLPLFTSYIGTVKILNITNHDVSVTSALPMYNQLVSPYGTVDVDIDGKPITTTISRVGVPVNATFVFELVNTPVYKAWHYYFE